MNEILDCICDRRDPLKQCPYHERETARVIGKLLGREDVQADIEYDELRADGFRSAHERQLAEEAEERARRMY